MVPIRLSACSTGANTTFLSRSALDCSLPFPTRPRKSLSSLAPCQGKMPIKKDGMLSFSLTLRVCGIASVRMATSKSGMLVEEVDMSVLWAIRYVWFAYLGPNQRLIIWWNWKQWYNRRKHDADCFVGNKFRDPVPHEENCPCQKFDYEWCVLQLPMSCIQCMTYLILPATLITSVRATSAFLSDLNLSPPVFVRMNATTKSTLGRPDTDLCLVILARRKAAMLWTTLSRNPVVKVRFGRCSSRNDC